MVWIDKNDASGYSYRGKVSSEKLAEVIYQLKYKISSENKRLRIVKSKAVAKLKILELLKISA
jgi:hypothetical protein